MPGTALKGILAHAGPEATAALRLASRATAAAVDDAAPCLSITLTSSTRREDIDAWLRATRKMAHAPELEIMLCGDCPAAVLDLLLARVAARGVPRAIVLRSAGDGGVAAAIPGACLARLAPGAAAGASAAAGIERLTIEGRLVADGGAERLLVPLAAACGASLRRLDLGTGWAGAAPLQVAAEALHALSALTRLEELRCALPAAYIAPPPAALVGLVESSGNVGAQLRDAAAGALRAVLPARGLRALTLSGLPDVWAPAKGNGGRAVGTAADDVEDGGAGAGLALPQALDGLAACLVAGGMSCLRDLEVSLSSGWAMRWSAGAAGGASAALALHGVDAVAQLAPPRGRGPARDAAPAAAGAVGGLAVKLERAMAPYLSVPSATAAVVMSLQLSLAPADVPELTDVLGGMPALRNLRVAAMATASAGQAPLAQLLAAAAAAPALESLVAVPGLAPAEVAPGTLAPLLAGPAKAALRHLKIVGCLRLRVAGGAEAEEAWAPLAGLCGLRSLSLHHVGAGTKLHLPGSCLPSGLRAVDFKGVNLTFGDDVTGTHVKLPELASVKLVGCDVTGRLSRSPLAGPHVTDAVIAGCKMGGWAEAACAWPGLTRLRASCQVAGAGAGGAEAACLLAAAGGLSKLASLQVQRLALLDDAALAALLQLPRLRRLSVAVGQCALTAGGIAAGISRTRVGEAGAPTQLNTLAVQLPAPHLPGHVKALLAGDGDAAVVAAGVGPEALPWWALPAAGAADGAAGAAAAAWKARPGGRLNHMLQVALPGTAVSVQLNQAPVAKASRLGPSKA